MKNNYPIKYAIMPIIAQTGWNFGIHELERQYDEVAYIVSKCYVVNESKEYLKDGTIKTNYRVVFPYEESEYGNWNRIEPKYNYIINQCVNCTVVDSTFNTFEEASKVAEILNDRLLSKKYMYLPIDKFEEQLVQKKSEFQQLLAHYKLLENLIEQKTDDLTVKSDVKKQTTIIIGDGKRGEYNTSIYNAMELWDSEYYVVYSLTEQEYIEVIDKMKSGADLSKYNKNCIAINNPLKKVVRISDSNNPKDVFYLTSNELISDNQEKFDLSNFDKKQRTIVFYTLENYEDIIKSFLTFINADELQLNNKIMAKVLKI